MKSTTILTTLALLFSLLFFPVSAVAQSPENNSRGVTGSAIHPSFPLFDENGKNVLDTGAPLSTMNTCGACHDADYIVNHSFHADVGLKNLTQAGQLPGGRPWDTSLGYFGKWNPLLYRYLTPAGDSKFDLGTPEWVQIFGPRHAGGGPAEFSSTGQPLNEMPIVEGDPATHVLDPSTGQPRVWDWNESGVVENNCFLCHIPHPNNAARTEALSSGNFKWANTVTLLGTGLLTGTPDNFQWNRSAFDKNGELTRPYIQIQDPSNENCGQCHGTVHSNNSIPLQLSDFSLNNWTTATTGQVFSPQRMFRSGVNLQNKDNLARSWDVHAERVVNCVDCHASTNNPIFFKGIKNDKLDHLVFDARRIDIEDYLHRPSHEFARGQSAQSNIDPEFSNTMRRCQGCHDPDAVHDWLPYKDAHFTKVSCETCHIPKIYAPAYQQVDWTVIHPDGTMQSTLRGTDGDPTQVNTLITGFSPLLLPQERIEGGTPLMPFNLISFWYWVQGNPQRPVRLADLKAAYLNGDTYRDDVLAAFDANDDGTLDDAELRLDSPQKEDLIRQNLEALGFSTVQIKAEVQPYSISHNVTNGEWATKDCTVCHSSTSVVAAAMPLSDYTPGGVNPALPNGSSVTYAGQVMPSENGGLNFQPDVTGQGLYIFGYNSVWWIDWLGILAFLGTFLGVIVHAGLRVYSAARVPHRHHKYQEVYMYSIYERLWHWLQALAIFLLIFTGLIIHKPDMFGIFSFPYVVQVHNVLGFLLLANALLAVFYHLASGEIQQFIPQPNGFFNQMITQAIFYTKGIFRDEKHPFEKTPQKKLNPLQQITYFGLLNVLLPLQVITGVIVWGMQNWPDFAVSLGGLPVLAPIHTLIAWLFASFIVMHMYLTTTGHKPLGGVQSMINGWDEVEVLNGNGRYPTQLANTANYETSSKEAEVA